MRSPSTCSRPLSPAGSRNVHMVISVPEPSPPPLQAATRPRVSVALVRLSRRRLRVLRADILVSFRGDGRCARVTGLLWSVGGHADGGTQGHPRKDRALVVQVGPKARDVDVQGAI